MDNKKIEHQDIFVLGLGIVGLTFSIIQIFRLLLLEFGLKNILIGILLIILGLILSYIVGWIVYRFGYEN